MLTQPLLAATACTRVRPTVFTFILLLMIIGAITLFATLNAQTRRRLAVANSQLASLGQENDRLRSMGAAAEPFSQRPAPDLPHSDPRGDNSTDNQP